MLIVIFALIVQRSLPVFVYDGQRFVGFSRVVWGSHEEVQENLGNFAEDRV